MHFIAAYRCTPTTSPHLQRGDSQHKPTEPERQRHCCEREHIEVAYPMNMMTKEAEELAQISAAVQQGLDRQPERRLAVSAARLRRETGQPQVSRKARKAAMRQPVRGPAQQDVHAVVRAARQRVARHAVACCCPRFYPWHCCALLQFSNDAVNDLCVSVALGGVALAHRAYLVSDALTVVVRS